MSIYELVCEVCRHGAVLSCNPTHSYIGAASKVTRHLKDELKARKEEFFLWILAGGVKAKDIHVLEIPEEIARLGWSVKEIAEKKKALERLWTKPLAPLRPPI